MGREREPGSWTSYQSTPSWYTDSNEPEIDSSFGPGPEGEGSGGSGQATGRGRARDLFWRTRRTRIHPATHKSLGSACSFEPDVTSGSPAGQKKVPTGL